MVFTEKSFQECLGNIDFDEKNILRKPFPEDPFSGVHDFKKDIRKNSVLVEYNRDLSILSIFGGESILEHAEKITPILISFNNPLKKDVAKNVVYEILWNSLKRGYDAQWKDLVGRRLDIAIYGTKSGSVLSVVQPKEWDYSSFLASLEEVNPDPQLLNQIRHPNILSSPIEVSYADGGKKTYALMTPKNIK